MTRLSIAAALAAITLLSFFQFPGHTWLQSDTQIYAPILEHLRNPAVLRNEMLVLGPHVSFTLYDEIAIGLRSLSHLEFQQVLALEQICFRGLGILGVYLMAPAAGLARWPALAAAAVAALGANIGGPSVLLWEYEPVPRGFAVPLLFLAAGLAAHRRLLAAAAAAGAAFLVHPPTVWPFWAALSGLALWSGRGRALAPLAFAAAAIAMAAWLQAGAGERQTFFAALDPLQEKLQRMRASYVWVSMWWGNWQPHYLALWVASLAATWRLGRKAAPELRFFLLALPLAGMLSIPLSWLLVEKLKWSLAPQLQPARALLFVVAAALFGAAAAGARAALERRRIEGFLWLTLAFLIPMHARLTALPPWNRAALAAALAVAMSLALRRPPAALACALAAFLAIPYAGRVVNYPGLHTRELHELSAWARIVSPSDAVFLFPDAGRDLDPGIFRAQALRAVYVDWKGGGQVNYLKELGELWWQRWQAAMEGGFAPGRLPDYRRLGVDYIVLRRQNRLADRTPVFENARYLVYRAGIPHSLSPAAARSRNDQEKGFTTRTRP